VILWAGHDADALNFIRQSKALNAGGKLFASYTVGVPTADFRKLWRRTPNTPLA